MTIDRTLAYRAIDSVFVNHPNFATAYEDIRDLIELKPVHTAPCIHVSGPSGVGKTTLKKRVERDYPAEPNGALVRFTGGLTMVADRHRLITLRMPESPTVKGLAREILKAYGDQAWNRGDEYTLGDRVDRFIAASQSDAIMIDDAQRAIERSGTVVSDKLIDWIKSRHENNCVGFILLGLGNLRHLFEADRQIERRWDAEIRLEPYAWFHPDGTENLEGQANFIGLLAKFRDLSPIPFKVDIQDDDIAFRFFYLSRGLVDGVKKVLLGGVRLMRRTGRDGFDLPLLEQATAAAFRLDQHGMQNPFAVNFQARPPPPLEDDYKVVVAKKRAKLSGKRLAQVVNAHLIR